MSMAQEYEMLSRMVYEAFGDQLQVVMNIYAKYNMDTLALLDDADYKERLARLSDVSKAYVSISIEKIQTQNIINRIEARMNKFRDAGDWKGVELWEEELENCKRWMGLQEALFKQAQSQFALFRPIALVQAFKQKKKRGGIMGASRTLLDKLLGKKKAMEKEGMEAEMPEGLDPEKVLEGAMRDVSTVDG